MAFIPHTRDDVQHMLDVIGIDSTERLFEEIPANLRCGELAALPAAMPEMAIGRLMSERAAQDVPLLNFIGAGAYEHHIPAAVWSLVTRGEFYSAYTPYQAEASQGTLQVIYEFQSMMTHLTGMQASNASMYDGASALAEACLMAVRAHRRSRSARILMPRTVHPYYRRCARAIVEGQALSLSDVGFDTTSGCIDINSLRALEGQDVTAVVIAQPNFFGNLEDVDALTDWAHAQGALVIAVVNPISLAVLKPPGEWGAKGADIVVGEGQPLGVPLSSGGPYFGFMTTRLDMVRQMPGRVVGRTVDADGTPGFTLTLQAREQHIRRGKATSNICTNQGLVMTAATIYLSIMGASGLTRVAAASMARCQQLVATLCALPGVRRAFVGGAGFHEAVLQLDRPVAPWLQALAERGIAGGLDISTEYPELGDAVLVCATETRTTADIAAYGAAAAAAMGVRS